jgi:hypothetical protein
LPSTATPRTDATCVIRPTSLLSSASRSHLPLHLEHLVMFTLAKPMECTVCLPCYRCVPCEVNLHPMSLLLLF